MNALVIEDDPYWAEVLQAVLALRGCRSRHSSSVTGGALALQLEPVDLVLLDLRLPDSPVEATLNEIPRLKALGGRKVYIVSGVEETRCMRELSLSLGADGWLPKEGPLFSHRLEAVLLEIQGKI